MVDVFVQLEDGVLLEERADFRLKSFLRLFLSIRYYGDRKGY